MLRRSRLACFKRPPAAESLSTSVFDKFLDRTAPAHLRGMLAVERDREAKGQADEQARVASAAAKKDDPFKNKVATKSSAAEHGFVRGPGFGKSKPGVPDVPEQRAKSQSKYEVQWTDELEGKAAAAAAASAAAAATGSTSSSSQQQPEPQSLGDKIGSNLQQFNRMRQRQQQVDAEIEQESDVLSALGHKPDKAGDAAAEAKAKKDQPGLFKRLMSSFSLGREDASAERAGDGEGDAPYEELSEDKLQTGKYFKKLHAASLKSWTKQCFQRMDSVVELKLVSVEVETNAETDVVTVFVCADGGFDDKRLAEVKKWVESICPVTKTRLKLIQQMEEDDRKHSAHVLAKKNRPGGARHDPLRQFANRKNIRWIRVEQDQK